MILMHYMSTRGSYHKTKMCIKEKKNVVVVYSV